MESNKYWYRPASRPAAVKYLAGQWTVYNLVLFLILYFNCDNFNHTEIETVISMALVSFGLSVIQYDCWVLKVAVKPKTLQADTDV